MRKRLAAITTTILLAVLAGFLLRPSGGIPAQDSLVAPSAPASSFSDGMAAHRAAEHDLKRAAAIARQRARARARALRARLAAMTPQQIVYYLLPPGPAACLSAIFTRESGWNVYATNPGSGAYGIPQALPGSKMASAGADWRTNPWTQIRWAIGYVDERYGGACNAWAYWQAHSNY